MEMITVLKIMPGCKPERISIPGSLNGIQETVGGTFQVIYPFSDMVGLVCHDEGKLIGLEPNRALRDSDTGEILDVICGTFFICGWNADDFCALEDAQIAHYSKLFQYPEVFLWNGHHLVVLQMECV